MTGAFPGRLHEPQAAAFAVVVFLSSIVAVVDSRAIRICQLALAFAGIALVFRRDDRPDKIVKSLLIASLSPRRSFQTDIHPSSSCGVCEIFADGEKKAGYFRFNCDSRSVRPRNGGAERKRAGRSFLAELHSH